jgi:hypothetical protein
VRGRLQLPEGLNVTDVTSGSATTWLTDTDRVYVGWHYAQVHPDPGPPPRRPRPPEAEQISEAWLAAQRHEENLLNRPLKIAVTGTSVGVLMFVLLAATGLLPWMFAGVGLVACAFIFLITGYAIWQSEQALRSRVNEERARLERQRQAGRRRLNVAHKEHARAYRAWERHRRAYETQHDWYPVSVPPGADRVDVAGGTLAGWSAVVTMMGAARLAAGSEVTVLDLSEGAVAHDLVRLAADRGDDPVVWVLPADLPRLDLTAGLRPAALADVLSSVVGAGEDQSTTRDLSLDNAILERVLGVLGDGVNVRRITAALRALAQVGDPRDDLRSGLLTEAQLGRITTMFGRGATDRVVIERAWTLESQLRKLEALGTEPVRLPPSRLRVVSMDRRAGVLTNRVLGTYVATALTHGLRQSPAGRRWDHTLFLCGAEKLRGDVLDRLTDACETTGTGLVLMYRSIPPHVRERLGRGHAAVGFMRLGNAEDARVAVEHIGAEQRLLVAGITDTAGELVADRKGDPYASTVAYARTRGGDALTDPVWSRLPDPAEDDEALVRGISTRTPWGRSVAGHADPDHEGATGSEPGAPAETESGRRSRELLVERHRLQELPPTAMVFTHATANGRRTLLVDANPGIMTLPTAHRLEYEDYLRRQAGLVAPEGPEEFGAGQVDPDPGPGEGAGPRRPPDTASRPAGGAGERDTDPPGPGDRDGGAKTCPPPNLGPPPERLDFRRKKR